MQIAQVLGTVVSTQKELSLEGTKFLVLQFVDPDGTLLPNYEVAADSVGAGFGEWVLVSRGSAARQLPGKEHRPLDALVIAIIDTVTVENTRMYNKRDSY